MKKEKMAIIKKKRINTKVDVLELEKLLCKNLKIGKRPTRAVETTLEEYNNSRSEKNGICVMTVWRYYKKLKDKIK